MVLRYTSDLPMIPIVLTSVAAQPDMGIQVWMLGQGRAIPRNYYHTVLNDSKIDWLSSGANYNDVVIAATREAPGRHTFVTEYAGSSAIMRRLLNAPGRFGSATELAAQTSEIAFVDYLNGHGFSYTSQLTSLLGRYIPVPAALATQGINAAQFYAQISYYLGAYRSQRPQDFVGYVTDYRPLVIAQEIADRVITPTLAAGALFDSYPYLTRLYTTLSPEDMSKDPVFSYNAQLPPYTNIHEGTLTYHCGFFGSDDQATTSAVLKTASGWEIDYPAGVGNGIAPFTPPAGPSSERIEILAEEGLPTQVTDNSMNIAARLGNGGGCNVGVGARAGRTGVGVAGFFLLGLALFRQRRMRRAS